MLFLIFLLIILVFGWEGVIVIGALLIRLLAIIFVVICFLGVILAFKEYEDKVERGGFETAGEMKIKSEIAAQQAVAEFRVWQEWDSKLTKSQRDSIKRSLDKAYEDSKPKCPKCHREFSFVRSDPQDYIDGVGKVCTHCYIENYKKHKQ